MKNTKPAKQKSIIRRTYRVLSYLLSVTMLLQLVLSTTYLSASVRGAGKADRVKTETSVNSLHSGDKVSQKYPDANRMRRILNQPKDFYVKNQNPDKAINSANGLSPSAAINTTAPQENGEKPQSTEAQGEKPNRAATAPGNANQNETTGKSASATGKEPTASNAGAGNATTSPTTAINPAITPNTSDAFGGTDPTTVVTTPFDPAATTKPTENIAPTAGALTTTGKKRRNAPPARRGGADPMATNYAFKDANLNIYIHNLVHKEQGQPFTVAELQAITDTIVVPDNVQKFDDLVAKDGSSYVFANIKKVDLRQITDKNKLLSAISMLNERAVLPDGSAGLLLVMTDKQWEDAGYRQWYEDDAGTLKNLAQNPANPMQIYLTNSSSQVLGYFIGDNVFPTVDYANYEANGLSVLTSAVSDPELNNVPVLNQLENLHLSDAIRLSNNLLPDKLQALPLFAGVKALNFRTEKQGEIGYWSSGVIKENNFARLTRLPLLEDITFDSSNIVPSDSNARRAMFSQFFASFTRIQRVHYSSVSGCKVNDLMDYMGKQQTLYIDSYCFDPSLQKKYDKDGKDFASGNWASQLAQKVKDQNANIPGFAIKLATRKNYPFEHLLFFSDVVQKVLANAADPENMLKNGEIFVKNEDLANVTSINTDLSALSEAMQAVYLNTMRYTSDTMPNAYGYATLAFFPHLQSLKFPQNGALDASGMFEFDGTRDSGLNYLTELKELDLTNCSKDVGNVASLPEFLGKLVKLPSIATLVMPKSHSILSYYDPLKALFDASAFTKKAITVLQSEPVLVKDITFADEAKLRTLRDTYGFKLAVLTSSLDNAKKALYEGISLKDPADGAVKPLLPYLTAKAQNYITLDDYENVVELIAGRREDLAKHGVDTFRDLRDIALMPGLEKLIVLPVKNYGDYYAKPDYKNIAQHEKIKYLDLRGFAGRDVPRKTDAANGDYTPWDAAFKGTIEYLDIDGIDFNYSNADTVTINAINAMPNLKAFYGRKVKFANGVLADLDSKKISRTIESFDAIDANIFAAKDRLYLNIDKNGGYNFAELSLPLNDLLQKNYKAGKLDAQLQDYSIERKADGNFEYVRLDLVKKLEDKAVFDFSTGYKGPNSGLQRYALLRLLEKIDSLKIVADDKNSSSGYNSIYEEDFRDEIEGLVPSGSAALSSIKTFYMEGVDIKVLAPDNSLLDKFANALGSRAAQLENLHLGIAADYNTVPNFQWLGSFTGLKYLELPITGGGSFEGYAKLSTLANLTKLDLRGHRIDSELVPDPATWDENYTNTESTAFVAAMAAKAPNIKLTISADNLFRRVDFSAFDFVVDSVFKGGSDYFTAGEILWQAVQNDHDMSGTSTPLADTAAAITKATIAGMKTYQVTANSQTSFNASRDISLDILQPVSYMPSVEQIKVQNSYVMLKDLAPLQNAKELKSLELPNVELMLGMSYFPGSGKDVKVSVPYHDPQNHYGFAFCNSSAVLSLAPLQNLTKLHTVCLPGVLVEDLAPLAPGAGSRAPLQVLNLQNSAALSEQYARANGKDLPVGFHLNIPANLDLSAVKEFNIAGQYLASGVGTQLQTQNRLNTHFAANDRGITIDGVAAAEFAFLVAPGTSDVKVNLYGNLQRYNNPANGRYDPQQGQMPEGLNAPNLNNVIVMKAAESLSTHANDSRPYIGDAVYVGNDSRSEVTDIKLDDADAYEANDFKALYFFPNLRKFALQGTYQQTGKPEVKLYDQAGAEQVNGIDYSVFKVLTKLESLKLSDISNLKKYGSVDFVSNLQELNYLDIRGTGLLHNDQGAPAGTSYKAAMDLIANAKLKIFLNDDPDPAYTRDYNYATLTELSIDRPSGDNLNFLAPAVNLKRLVIRDASNLKDFSALANLASLEELYILNLPKYGVSDFTSLAQLPKLNTLHLIGKIQDKSGGSYQEYSEIKLPAFSATKLQDLELYNTRLTEQELTGLNAPGLKKLTLFDTKITDGSSSYSSDQSLKGSDLQTIYDGLTDKTNFRLEIDGAEYGNISDFADKYKAQVDFLMYQAYADPNYAPEPGSANQSLPKYLAGSDISGKSKILREVYLDKYLTFRPSAYHAVYHQSAAFKPEDNFYAFAQSYRSKINDFGVTERNLVTKAAIDNGYQYYQYGYYDGDDFSAMQQFSKLTSLTINSDHYRVTSFSGLAAAESLENLTLIGNYFDDYKGLELDYTNVDAGTATNPSGLYNLKNLTFKNCDGEKIARNNAKFPANISEKLDTLTLDNASVEILGKLPAGRGKGPSSIVFTGKLRTYNYYSGTVSFEGLQSKFKTNLGAYVDKFSKPDANGMDIKMTVTAPLSANALFADTAARYPSLKFNFRVEAQPIPEVVANDVVKYNVLTALIQYALQSGAMTLANGHTALQVSDVVTDADLDSLKKLDLYDIPGKGVNAFKVQSAEVPWQNPGGTAYKFGKIVNDNNSDYQDYDALAFLRELTELVLTDELGGGISKYVYHGRTTESLRKLETLDLRAISWGDKVLKTGSYNYIDATKFHPTLVSVGCKDKSYSYIKDFKQLYRDDKSANVNSGAPAAPRFRFDSIAWYELIRGGILDDHFTFDISLRNIDGTSYFDNFKDLSALSFDPGVYKDQMNLMTLMIYQLNGMSRYKQPHVSSSGDLALYTYEDFSKTNTFDFYLPKPTSANNPYKELGVTADDFSSLDKLKKYGLDTSSWYSPVERLIWFLPEVANITFGTNAGSDIYCGYGSVSDFSFSSSRYYPQTLKTLTTKLFLRDMDDLLKGSDPEQGLRFGAPLLQKVVFLAAGRYDTYYFGSGFEKYLKVLKKGRDVVQNGATVHEDTTLRLEVPAFAAKDVLNYRHLANIDFRIESVVGQKGWQISNEPDWVQRFGIFYDALYNLKGGSANSGANDKFLFTKEDLESYTSLTFNEGLYNKMHWRGKNYRPYTPNYQLLAFLPNLENLQLGSGYKLEKEKFDTALHPDFSYDTTTLIWEYSAFLTTHQLDVLKNALPHLKKLDVGSGIDTSTFSYQEDYNLTDADNSSSGGKTARDIFKDWLLTYLDVRGAKLTYSAIYGIAKDSTSKPAGNPDPQYVLKDKGAAVNYLHNDFANSYTDEKFIMLQNNVSLQDLSIINGAHDLEVLVLKNLPKLSDLSLLQDHFPKLRELYVYDVPQVKDYSFLKLREQKANDSTVAPAERYAHLTKLAISYSQYSSSSAAPYLELTNESLKAIAALSQLEELTLRRTNFSDFTSLDSSATTLQHLDLAYCKIPNHEVQTLGDLSQSFGRMQNLKFLNLAGMANCKDAILAALPASLKTSRTADGFTVAIANVEAPFYTAWRTKLNVAFDYADKYREYNYSYIGEILRKALSGKGSRNLRSWTLADKHYPVNPDNEADTTYAVTTDDAVIVRPEAYEKIEVANLPSTDEALNLSGIYKAYNPYAALEYLTNLKTLYSYSYYSYSDIIEKIMRGVFATKSKPTAAEIAADPFWGELLKHEKLETIYLSSGGSYSENNTWVNTFDEAVLPAIALLAAKANIKNINCDRNYIADPQPILQLPAEQKAKVTMKDQGVTITVDMENKLTHALPEVFANTVWGIGRNSGDLVPTFQQKKYPKNIDGFSIFFKRGEIELLPATANYTATSLEIKDGLPFVARDMNYSNDNIIWWPAKINVINIRPAAAMQPQYIIDRQGIIIGVAGIDPSKPFTFPRTVDGKAVRGINLNAAEVQRLGIKEIEIPVFVRTCILPGVKFDKVTMNGAANPEAWPREDLPAPNFQFETKLLVAERGEAFSYEEGADGQKHPVGQNVKVDTLDIADEVVRFNLDPGTVHEAIPHFWTDAEATRMGYDTNYKYADVDRDGDGIPDGIKAKYIKNVVAALYFKAEKDQHGVAADTVYYLVKPDGSLAPITDKSYAGLPPWNKRVDATKIYINPVVLHVRYLENKEKPGDPDVLINKDKIIRNVPVQLASGAVVNNVKQNEFYIFYLKEATGKDSVIYERLQTNNYITVGDTLFYRGEIRAIDYLTGQHSPVTVNSIEEKLDILFKKQEREFVIDPATGILLSYVGNKTSVTIPLEVDGYAVKGFDKDLFNNQQGLKVKSVFFRDLQTIPNDLNFLAKSEIKEVTIWNDKPVIYSETKKVELDSIYFAKQRKSDLTGPINDVSGVNDNISAKDPKLEIDKYSPYNAVFTAEGRDLQVKVVTNPAALAFARPSELSAYYVPLKESDLAKLNNVNIKENRLLMLNPTNITVRYIELSQQKELAPSEIYLQRNEFEAQKFLKTLTHKNFSGFKKIGRKESTERFSMVVTFEYSPEQDSLYIVDNKGNITGYYPENRREHVAQLVLPYPDYKGKAVKGFSKATVFSGTNIDKIVLPEGFEFIDREFARYQNGTEIEIPNTITYVYGGSSGMGGNEISSTKPLTASPLHLEKKADSNILSFPQDYLGDAAGKLNFIKNPFGLVRSLHGTNATTPNIYYYVNPLTGLYETAKLDNFDQNGGYAINPATVTLKCVYTDPNGVRKELGRYQFYDPSHSVRLASGQNTMKEAELWSHILSTYVVKNNYGTSTHFRLGDIANITVPTLYAADVPDHDGMYVPLQFTVQKKCETIDNNEVTVEFFKANDEFSNIDADIKVDKFDSSNTSPYLKFTASIKAKTQGLGTNGRVALADPYVKILPVIGDKAKWEKLWNELNSSGNAQSGRRDGLITGATRSTDIFGIIREANPAYIPDSVDVPKLSEKPDEANLFSQDMNILYLPYKALVSGVHLTVPVGLKLRNFDDYLIFDHDEKISLQLMARKSLDAPLAEHAMLKEVTLDLPPYRKADPKGRFACRPLDMGESMAYSNAIDLMSKGFPGQQIGMEVDGKYKTNLRDGGLYEVDFNLPFDEQGLYDIDYSMDLFDMKSIGVGQGIEWPDKDHSYISAGRQLSFSGINFPNYDVENLDFSLQLSKYQNKDGAWVYPKLSKYPAELHYDAEKGILQGRVSDISKLKGIWMEIWHAKAETLSLDTWVEPEDTLRKFLDNFGSWFLGSFGKNKKDAAAKHNIICGKFSSRVNVPFTYTITCHGYRAGDTKTFEYSGTIGHEYNGKAYVNVEPKTKPGKKEHLRYYHEADATNLHVRQRATRYKYVVSCQPEYIDLFQPVSLKESVTNIYDGIYEDRDYKLPKNVVEIGEPHHFFMYLDGKVVREVADLAFGANDQYYYNLLENDLQGRLKALDRPLDPKRDYVAKEKVVRKEHFHSKEMVRNSYTMRLDNHRDFRFTKLAFERDMIGKIIYYDEDGSPLQRTHVLDNNGEFVRERDGAGNEVRTASGSFKYVPYDPTKHGADYARYKLSELSAAFSARSGQEIALPEEAASFEIFLDADYVNANCPELFTNCVGHTYRWDTRVFVPYVDCYRKYDPSNGKSMPVPPAAGCKVYMSGEVLLRDPDMNKIYKNFTLGDESPENVTHYSNVDKNEVLSTEFLIYTAQQPVLEIVTKDVVEAPKKQRLVNRSEDKFGNFPYNITDNIYLTPTEAEEVYSNDGRPVDKRILADDHYTSFTFYYFPDPKLMLNQEDVKGVLSPTVKVTPMTPSEIDALLTKPGLKEKAENNAADDPQIKLLQDYRRSYSPEQRIYKVEVSDLMHYQSQQLLLQVNGRGAELLNATFKNLAVVDRETIKTGSTRNMKKDIERLDMSRYRTMTQLRPLNAFFLYKNADGKYESTGDLTIIPKQGEEFKFYTGVDFINMAQDKLRNVELFLDLDSKNIPLVLTGLPEITNHKEDQFDIVVAYEDGSEEVIGSSYDQTKLSKVRKVYIRQKLGAEGLDAQDTVGLRIPVKVDKLKYDAWQAQGLYEQNKTKQFVFNQDFITRDDNGNITLRQPNPASESQVIQFTYGKFEAENIPDAGTRDVLIILMAANIIIAGSLALLRKRLREDEMKRGAEIGW